MMDTKEKPFGECLLTMYVAANELMAKLGADGEINAQQDESGNLMDALFDIDDGAYDQELVKKKLISEQYKIDGTVIIRAAPLRQLLSALIGPSHYIREIQATMDLPFNDANPLKQVLNEFNEQMK